MSHGEPAVAAALLGTPATDALAPTRGGHDAFEDGAGQVRIGDDRIDRPAPYRDLGEVPPAAGTATTDAVKIGVDADHGDFVRVHVERHVPFDEDARGEELGVGGLSASWNLATYHLGRAVDGLLEAGTRDDDL